MELTKRKDENEFQYLWRIDNLIRDGKYKNWAEVTPIVNAELFDDEEDYLGESAYRKKVASARKFYEAGVFDTFTNDDYIKRLSEQKRSLEIEKTKYRDERNSWSRQNRLQARTEELFDHLEDLIKSQTPYNSADSASYNTESILDNDLVICLSDYHAGIYSKGTFINTECNEDVIRKRLKNYVLKIRDICYRHQSENAYILLLGDQIDGKIHFTQILEARMNIVEQIQRASEDISWFIYEVSKMFDNTYVVSVSGNHSRISDKEKVLRDERLDDIVTWYAKAKLVNVESVKFYDCMFDPTIAAIPIRGKNYFAVHGDYDTFDASGIQRLSMFCHMIPEGVFMGHKHTTDYSECSGVSLVRSGTFVNGGDYVTKNRFVSKPSQAVCVVDKNGINAFYPVDLCVE